MNTHFPNRLYGAIAALIIAVTLAVASALPALAFPTQDTQYPSFSGCTTNLTAYAGHTSGTGYERVDSFHTDVNNCASTVAATAKALILGYGVITGGPDIDAYQAIASIDAPDYYYGYGLGSMYVGGSSSGDTSTVSIHP